MLNIYDRFKKVNPSVADTIINLFKDCVPPSALVSADKSHWFKAQKPECYNFAWLQCNLKNSVHVLVYDIDNYYVHDLILDETMPVPNCIAENPDNGHFHAFYFLQNKVYSNNAENMKPYRYLSAIDKALTEYLNADKSYNKHVCKNILSDKWNVMFFHDYLWHLDDFKFYITLPRQTLQKTFHFVHSLGRNCTVFYGNAKQAFRILREWNFNMDFFELRTELYMFAERVYQPTFVSYLPHNELINICTSNSKFTLRHGSLEAFTKHQLFANSHRVKQQKETAEKDYKAILDVRIANPHLSTRDIAKQLSTSQSKVVRALKHFDDFDLDKL